MLLVNVHENEGAEQFNYATIHRMEIKKLKKNNQCII